MRIAVTGMGIISACGRGPDAFAAAIEAGTPGDRAAPHLAAPEHQAKVAATIPIPEFAEQAPGAEDRVYHLADQALADAEAAAGLRGALDPARTALVVGTSLGGVIAGQEWHEARLNGGEGARAAARQAPLHAVTDELAHRRGLTGPRTTVSNACVSGTNAIGIGLDMLRAGECDVALVGGVDTLHRFNFCGFATLWALTSEKCRPFDATRTGMLLGEAGAFLVLETEAHAAARGAAPLAEVAGYGSSGDAVHITAPDREGGGAFRAMSAALADAGLTAADVDLVSLHGTGTMYADGMEAAAMGRVFGDRSGAVPAFSLRPITGHTLASAGAVDSVACVLALARGFVPGTPNHLALDPDLPAPVGISSETRRLDGRVALNTSSGFAGSNASVVFRRWGTPDAPRGGAP